ncbi:MAG: ABC transporter substrate-binding protein, partial [Candidatus Scatosoma sp.]
ESKPDGESGNSVKDKLQGMYKEAGQYEKDGTSHYYVMPWTQMVTGIAYNAELFERYQLEVPATMEEFDAVCDAIIEKSTAEGKRIAPFVVPGKINGYFDFLGKNWWIQASGIEGVKEFFAYDTVEVFNPDKEPTKGYARALTEFSKYFGSQKGQFDKYVLSGSMAKDAYTAQSDFINGNAAMIINANWLENEMINMVQESGFRMKLMRVPFLSDAKKDESGKYIAVNYAAEGFDFMSIPKQAKEVEGAKKFLSFMCRESQLKAFTKTTGTLRPFEYDYNSLRGELSEFSNSVLDIYDTSAVTYFDYATGPRRYKASRNLTQLPYMSIVNGGSVAEILQQEYEEAKIRWNNEWAI